MSAFPDAEIRSQSARRRELSPLQFAAFATALAVIGLSTIWPAVFSLWTLWTTDALKSIGMMIPPVSLVLILRAWRTLRWEVEGTWWGLVPLLIAMVAVWTQQRAVLLLVVTPRWATVLPPPSLVLMTYALGVVLLIGGVRLCRAALFPIVLLWFANPVPHVFSLWVDLPLQTISAHIARAFAMHLGQPLTPDHLRLMFTPEFGMFIAPGCNGIRGSVTMGFIALIAGYVYRFRWYTNALVVVGAVLLGYAFNLLRLCTLVLYYLVALHFPSLQDKAENADYLIGALLFLAATFFLFTVIFRFSDAGDPDVPQLSVARGTGAPDASAWSGRYALLATLGAIAVSGCAGMARATVLSHASASMLLDTGMRPFPQRIGNYTLVRSWDETLVTGPVVYYWAEYVSANGGTPITIGLAPLLGWHDPILCHTVRGEYPAWQGQLVATTADMGSTTFSSAFYSDGVTQYIEVSTQCNGTSCGEFATQRTTLGFIYSRPDPKSLFDPGGQRAIPVLVREESLDTRAPSDVVRQRLTREVQTFLASVNLDDLTRPYNR